MTPRGFLRSAWPPAAAVAAFVAVWEGVARAGWFPPYLFPGPSDVFEAFRDDWSIVWAHAAATFGIAVAGFAVGAAAGLAVAFLLHLVRPLRSAFAPLLILTQNVPVVVLAPLLVVWFGFGWVPKIVLLTLVCFFPIAVSALDGLGRADRHMTEYMRMAGASRWQTFVKLELPWSLPATFSGLKVSAAYSVMGSVIAEWAGAQKGLGVYLNLMRSGFRVDHMFVAIAVIAALSLLMFAVAAAAERKLIFWHRDRG